MENGIKNLYEILDVPKCASTNEIKLAYKKMVRLYHPDINKSKGADVQFKLINTAYKTLLDEERRKNYDILLAASIKTEKIKKIHPDENSVIKEIKITEEEKQTGTTRVVNILNTKLCPKCMGRKFLGNLPCGFCKGEGEKKELKKIEVQIPQNVQNNELIYVCKINSSALYDKNLFLKIKIEAPCKIFYENGTPFIPLNVFLYDVILGKEFEINIPNYGLYKFLVPKLSKNGDKIQLDIEENFHIYVKINVVFPEKITDEEFKLFEKLQNIKAKMCD